MSGAVDRGFCIRMDLPGLPFLFIAASQTPLATVLSSAVLRRTYSCALRNYCRPYSRNWLGPGKHCGPCPRSGPTPEAIVNVNWPPNAHVDMEARRSLEEYCSHYPNIQLAPDGAVSQVWPEWDVLEEMSGSQAPSSHPVVRGVQSVGIVRTVHLWKVPLFRSSTHI